MHEVRKYQNPWIPAGAMEVLANEQGTILDVGGGAAPYFRAHHVMDIQPFDADRLQQNAWGRGGLQTSDLNESRSHKDTKDSPVATNQEQRTKYHEHFREPEAYTQMDLCAGEVWPFEDQSFDLGLCSHCLEDIRDPVQVVKQLARCCRRTLIVCPSRLFEQMRGVDHPRYCGMHHHLWLVESVEGVLCFRRKTQLIEFPKAHFVCPPHKRLNTEAGSMFYLADQPVAREVMFFEANEDLQEYVDYVRDHRLTDDVFVAPSHGSGWRRHVWYWRQKLRWEV